MKNPRLYVVATPIGNKSDLSARAIKILQSVDLIACEDSRVSKKLLVQYDIDAKLVSYHKFNEKQRTEELKKVLDAGKTVALISDAGTPCISDPGRILVKELFESGVEITSIPGASALTTFLSQIPRCSEEFAFVGFLPRIKSQQQELLKKFSFIDTVFYESANRLLDTLQNIRECFGDSAKVAVARELTKIYEETVCDCIGNIIDYYEKNTLKGEVVVMLYALKISQEDDVVHEKVKLLSEQGYSAKDISVILHTLYGYNKNNVYKLALSSKQQ